MAEDYDDAPWKRLAHAILFQALADVGFKIPNVGPSPKFGRPRTCDLEADDSLDAYIWLTQMPRWEQVLCWGCGYDPEWVKDKVLEVAGEHFAGLLAAKRAASRARTREIEAERAAKEAERQFQEDLRKRRLREPRPPAKPRKTSWEYARERAAKRLAERRAHMASCKS